MPVYHRTRRLQIYGDKPEVTTLFGNRYQMVVRCEAKHDTEAWYNSNKSQIFADFGTLYDAEMAIDGIEPRTGEAYDNMVLVSNEAGYTQTGEYIVTFVYQTLTADFVQEAADKVDYELNGLRRVTRPLIAKDGSDYYNVPDAMMVEGAGTAAVNGVYLRDGDLNGKPSFVFGDYLLQNRQDILFDSNGFPVLVDGSQTFNNWNFYDTVAENVPYYGDTDDRNEQTPATVSAWYAHTQVFGLDAATEATPTVRQATWADIDAAGIDPSTVPVLSGSEKVIGTSTISHTGHGYDTETLTLASAVEDAKGPNEGGYVRIVETWVEPGTLSESEDKVGSQKAITIQAIGEAPSTPSGYRLARTSVGNYEGFQTNDYTFLNPSVISESEDKVGSQKAVVIEAFNETPSTPEGYSLAQTQESDVEGIPTKRFTFLKPSVLSESEDKVGSQLAITIEAFNETPSTPAGYSLAQTQKSDVEGIPTNRFTFLKDDAVLSRSIREQNGGDTGTGKVRIETVEVFNGTPTSDISGVKIGEEESNVDGIPTKRFTFAKGDGQIRTSSRPGPTSIPGTSYVTVEAVGDEVTPGGELVASADIEENGYVRYVRTTLQGEITGTKQEYKDVVEVQTPGIVTLEIIAVSNEITQGEGSTISGQIATVNVTPPRTKKIAATATVEITDSPPDTAELAYDLGEISCSVTTIKENYSRSAGPTVTAADGNTAVSRTGYRQNFSSSVNTQTFPGCYLEVSEETGTVLTGTVLYISANIPRLASSSSIVTDTSISTSVTTCTGTGSTDETGYDTTGVLRRKSRPVLTTLDGTTYYEVVTWSVEDVSE